MFKKLKEKTIEDPSKSKKTQKVANPTIVLVFANVEYI